MGNNDRLEPFLSKRMKAIENVYGSKFPRLGDYRTLLESSMEKIGDSETKGKIEEELTFIDKDLTEYKALQAIISFWGKNAEPCAVTETKDLHKGAEPLAIALVESHGNMEEMIKKGEVMEIGDAVKSYMRAIRNSRGAEECTHIIEEHARRGILNLYPHGDGKYVGNDELQRFLGIEHIEEELEILKKKNKTSLTINETAILLGVGKMRVKQLKRNDMIESYVSGHITINSLQRYISGHPVIEKQMQKYISGHPVIYDMAA